ncbi:hypothetical protein [Ruminococcus sp.]|uniref:hypothetical protein n=1 Tax=Ruminococcus sp. TaxID=41978 RepID=UPI001B230964|nr:hypothetical protein [Ruminococcus sp.]MBE6872725.1 hypothetical protein [Ruminococcus albus]MBO5558686.1 hypothetical protein [Ruminococcus sp.]MBQ9542679.1 hypothetical protein [Ruminococcus sp.]MBR0528802.1 hypothetical protein [Ruminococcus sp.]
MDYSDANFGKMQEEAVRRVMEMQQRSRSAVGGDRQPTPPPQKDPPNDIFGGLLGGIKLDEEKALIALLIYILHKNGADIKLLLGLAYLLL